ncbi:hypothetical protein [Bacillus sp. FJAT-45350]|uniref:hypothetical protein n=1 Tax=Bacillus sp. FJAT-45350 TaxID=2011014 RepID=UPI000BB9B4AD|nr:hypothetical protein [Bacillus sp. FJAT-45350]
MLIPPVEQDYTRITFRALADAIIPTTLQTDYSSSVQYNHAELVAEYIIYSLEHYISIQQQLYRCRVPLALPTAQMLDIGAARLINTNQLNVGLYASLSREDRIHTLALLENLDVDLFLLPNPYYNDGGLVKHIIDALNRFAMFAYYSEWSAYGTTRLYPPQNRKLEHFPVSWSEVGYPGPSYGYRDFRGFLLKMNRTGGV